MIPATTARVPAHTPPEYNQRIHRTTRANVARFAAQGREAIDRRLAELDHEWDIERVLETNASSLVVIGCALGAFVSRKFFLLPALVGTFLLQHAIQGWCPPVPFFRRRGVRTQREIDEERFALKALRGDFDHIGDVTMAARSDAEQAMAAARR
ncbi:MAG: hypothetical protein WD894_03220 [Pirellulales bacterium]